MKIKIETEISEYQAGMIYGFAWSLMQSPDIEIQDTARQVFECMQPQMLKRLGAKVHDEMLNELASQAAHLHEQNQKIMDFMIIAERVRKEAKNN